MSDYKVQLLHKEDYKTTRWSGGMTTELSITPEDKIYGERDFMWRLSSATVEVEESEFTSLPDYNRIIMTLKGGIRLAHNKGEWIELPEFVPHCFDGGDETVSIGKVIDFNLMLRKGVCSGELVPYAMFAGERESVNDSLSGQLENCTAVMLYCYKGTLLISTEEKGETYRLETGDTLKLTGTFNGATLSCLAETDTLAVAAVVMAK